METEHFKSKTIKGTFAILVRQIVVQLLNVAGAIILSWILTPRDFGIYAIFNFLIFSIMNINEVGLGAALIHEGKEIEKNDLKQIFTMQFAFIAVISVLLYIAAPYMIGIYHLDAKYAIFIRYSGLLFIVIALRSISYLSMERRLEFGKIGIIEIIETLFFQLSVIICALLGYGAISFLIGFIIQGILWLLLSYMAAPWQIGFHFEMKRAVDLLKFGIPYQGATIITLAKDSFVPLFIGAVIGLDAVGYINLATLLALYPVLFLKITSRILFPAFSNIKHNKQLFEKMLGKSVRLNNFLIYGALVLIIAFPKEIITYIYSAKWLPAIPLLYCFCFANLFQGSVMPILSAFNALGKSKIYFMFSLLWLCLTWVVGYPLIAVFGYIGFGYAAVLIQLTNFLVYFKIKDYISVNIWENTKYFLCSFALSTGAVMAIKHLLPIANVFMLFIYCIVSLAIYLLMIIVFTRLSLYKEIADILKSLKIKGA